VSSLQTIVHWITQNPLATSAFFFGGAILAVTLYTYFYDYKMLTKS